MTVNKDITLQQVSGLKALQNSDNRLLEQYTKILLCEATSAEMNVKMYCNHITGNNLLHYNQSPRRCKFYTQNTYVNSQ